MNQRALLNQNTPRFNTAILLTTLLTLFIVALGAYVRLSDAGLGCPDWPGCYGHVGVPDTVEEITIANQAYPERPVEAPKAWKEMIHRYFASALGLFIIGLAITAWKLKRSLPDQQLLIPSLLVPLVCLQGAFGMWTVTLKVHPVFVTLHLLFGLLTLSLLWLMWLKQRLRASTAAKYPKNLKRLAPVTLLILVLQIFLGGWVSTNYAALHCQDFPTCQGEYWPEMNFRAGFDLLLPIGPDYEGGHLDNTGRVTIHVAHRIGALVTTVFVALLCLRCIVTTRNQRVKTAAKITAGLLLAQLGLGVSNILFSLPLPVAVAHNAVAALLLLGVISLNYLPGRKT
jgi:cytochrome c oxidase assembly protein subunit 15